MSLYNYLLVELCSSVFDFRNILKCFENALFYIVSSSGCFTEGIGAIAIQSLRRPLLLHLNNIHPVISRKRLTDLPGFHSESSAYHSGFSSCSRQGRALSADC